MAGATADQLSSRAAHLGQAYFGTVTRPGAPDQQLAAFSLASQLGNERQAVAHVVDAVRPLHLSHERLERLKTAVAEATLNAMEHGNHFQIDRPVKLTVAIDRGDLVVSVVDLGGPLPPDATQEPDLEAKLAGRQSPRGWGLFLIRHMVDDLVDECVGQVHSVHLRLRLNATRQAKGLGPGQR